MGSDMDYVKEHTACRVCDGPLVEVLDYGKLPLANALAKTQREAEDAERFEQRLMICEKCFLGQLSVVVSPEILYKDYVYRSSVNVAFQKNCADLAKKISQSTNETWCSLLDIGGNDGTMVRQVLGGPRIGKAFVVDPSQDDEPEGYAKIKKFWNMSTADAFVSEYGRMDFIVAQNVVGHVDDITGFFSAVRMALADRGYFIVEVPSFGELIQSCAFDTVYHEHVSYWTAPAMQALCDRTGFEMTRAEPIDSHCGSIRFWMRKAIKKFESLHFELDSLELLNDFRGKVNSKVAALSIALNTWRPEKIVGITASAKSNVTLNILAEVNGPFQRIPYLVDDTQAKLGLYSPGYGIPIKEFTAENLAEKSVAVILSRNLVGPLSEKLNRLGFAGITLTV